MITFNLNGRKVEVDCEPMDRLSDVLRNKLGLKGTKVGCNSGDCGSCSIIFDEDLCCSCPVSYTHLTLPTILRV